MPASVAVSRPDTSLSIEQTALTALHGALVGELESQRSQITDLQATVEDLTGQTDGDSVLAREVAERSILRGLDVIADVEHAIRSIAEGTYGTCESCHDTIAPARLEAIPYARHCISCAPAAA